MTVSSTTRKAGPFACDGSQVDFPFDFKVFAAADVLVVHTDTDDVETTLELTTDYTVSLNADQNANPGGTVTTGTAYAVGEKITLGSQVAQSQTLDLTVGGDFNPSNITDALDRQAILTQQLAEEVGRSIKVGFSSETTPDALLASIAASVNEAADSATAAAVSESAASGYATSAGGSATAAGNAQTAAEAARDAAIAASAGRLLDVKVFTANGTWPKPSGVTASGFCIVKVWGGGGGGGSATAAASQAACGGGGGGGGFVMYKVSAANISDGAAVVVGVAGAGGASGFGGGTGGRSTVEVNGGTGTIGAEGGTGGYILASGTSVATAGGGSNGVSWIDGITTGVTTLLARYGQMGEGGLRISGTVAIGGAGGATHSTSGGESRVLAGVGNSARGGQYGAGGGGACSLSSTGYAGGDGKGGLVIIETYA